MKTYETAISVPYGNLLIDLRATTPEHQRLVANPLGENKCQVNVPTPETIKGNVTRTEDHVIHDSVRDQTSMETDIFSCDDCGLMFDCTIYKSTQRNGAQKINESLHLSANCQPKVKTMIRPEVA